MRRGNGWRRRVLQWGFIAWSSLLAMPALAQGADKAEAEVLFQTGRSLVVRGELESACKKFEASQKLDPALGTMLHLADCYDRLHKPASAWALFREAASLAEAANQPVRAEIARTRANALESKLPRLELRVTEPAPAGLELTVSDAPVPSASWGIAYPVDPGTRVVKASAPGFVPWSATIEVPEQEPKVVIVEVPALEREAAPPAPPVVSPRSPPPPDHHAAARLRAEKAVGVSAQRASGIALGVTGLASLAIASVFGVEALVTNQASLDECRTDDPTRCSLRGVELRNRAKSFALGSTIGFSVGGGLLATGLIVFFSAPSPEAHEMGRLGLEGKW